MATNVGRVEAIHETDSALKVRMEDGKELWFPQDHIDDDSEVWNKGQEGNLVVSDWIAEEKGLI